MRISRKFFTAGLIFLTLFISSILVCAAEETLTITTYYPSPYGSYRELTAHRMKIGTTYSGFGTTVSDNNLIVQGTVGIETATVESGVNLEVAGRIKITGGDPEGSKVLTSTDSNGVAPRE